MSDAIRERLAAARHPVYKAVRLSPDALDIAVSVVEELVAEAETRGKVAGMRAGREQLGDAVQQERERCIGVIDGWPWVVEERPELKAAIRGGAA